MLTQEKANQISEFLSKDMEHTKAMLDMEPADVLAAINAAGIDCTLDEITEYGKALNSALQVSQKEELNEQDLDQVAGGALITITAGLVAGLVGCFVGGVAVGGGGVFLGYKIVKHGW